MMPENRSDQNRTTHVRRLRFVSRKQICETRSVSRPGGLIRRRTLRNWTVENDWVNNPCSEIQMRSTPNALCSFPESWSTAWMLASGCTVGSPSGESRTSFLGNDLPAKDAIAFTIH